MANEDCLDNDFIEYYHSTTLMKETFIKDKLIDWAESKRACVGGWSCMKKV